MPNKPEPLFIDGHYHYTLSSYEPVEVTLTIPHLTDEEVGYGIAGIVAERGWNDDDLPTDAWLAENVEGINTLAELQQAVREELEQINARYVESTKAGLCAEELARRVEQRIPTESIERARDTVRQGFEMQAMQNGVDLARLLAASGMSEHDFEHAVSEEAQALAEQDAALDAIVDEYAIYVDETELPGILGMSPKDAKALIEETRKHGDYEDMMAFARRRRALESVIRDASFAEEHETAEQAARRVAEMRAQMQTEVPGDDADEDKGEEPRFKLV